MLRRLFGPLHLHTTRLPTAVQAIAAPIQVAHLKLLESELQTKDETVENALRSSLLPNEAWSDTEQWRSNQRLLAWLRVVHLRSTSSAARLLPQARSALQTRLNEPKLPPPSISEARALFELEHPSGRRRQPALERAMQRAAAASETVRSNQRAGPGATRELSFATVLEESGGLVQHRGAWAVFCEEHATFELITRELVGELACHVAKAAERRRARLTPPGAPTDAEAHDDLRVLEVGAGNGELSHYLRSALRARNVPATLVAIDNESWPVPHNSHFGGVEALSVSAALHKYEPHVVIASWMPMATDWTAAFRACPSVEEYLLLGECFDGACGHNWLTWGNLASAPNDCAVPPFVADGWRIEEIPAISRWMLSRFASDVEDCEWNSCAVSFRKRTNEIRDET